MKNLSPEIGCEIIENGIFQSGGGALLNSMRRYGRKKCTHVSRFCSAKTF